MDDIFVASQRQHEDAGFHVVDVDVCPRIGLRDRSRQIFAVRRECQSVRPESVRAKFEVVLVGDFANICFSSRHPEHFLIKFFSFSAVTGDYSAGMMPG